MMNSRVLVLFFLFCWIGFFSQTRKVKIKSQFINVPSIDGYVECSKEKVGKEYAAFNYYENQKLIAVYLNENSYSHGDLSLLYDGVYDCGFFSVFEDFEINVDQFNSYITENYDSISKISNLNILENPSSAKSKYEIIDSYSIPDVLFGYVALINIDDKIRLHFTNLLIVKNRIYNFNYFTFLTDNYSFKELKNNNDYLVHSFVKSNSSTTIDNINSKITKSKSVNSFYTIDGFDMGSKEEFLKSLPIDEEIIDLNGVSVNTSKFNSCLIDSHIANLKSIEIAKAIKKKDLSYLYPSDLENVERILSCIGDDFKVGESHYELCLEREMSAKSDVTSIATVEDYCRCECDKLKDLVNNYQDWKNYYNEIGDRNKPSYNEIILPCRNSVVKSVSPNQYNSVDVEGFSEQSIVKLTSDGTTFKIKLKFNGIVRYFLFDTGASELLINSEFEKELIENGSILPSDYVASKKFEIANGKIIEARGVKLNNIVIGGYRVNNVVAYISEQGGMLCGMGLMNKFKSWDLDKQNKMLTIYK